MKKKTKIALIIIAVVIFCVSCGLGGYFIGVRVKSKEYNLTSLTLNDLPALGDATEDEYVELSEVRMHYVKYGSGAQPIILIHGNGGSCRSLRELAGYLSNDYTVYCLESRCHGLSSDPGVITYDLMAKDVSEFIDKKLTMKPFIVGHSDGAIVAISFAAAYPEKSAGIVACGANSRPETFKFYFTLGVKIRNLFKKDKLNDLMLTLPDFTPELLGKVTVPTYVVAGEYDIMPLSDTVYIHKHIKNSKITIVKGANHSNYISSNGGKIYKLASGFFTELPQCTPLN